MGSATLYFCLTPNTHLHPVYIVPCAQLALDDFGEAVLGQSVTEETKAAFRKELGLDEPAYIRYVKWAGSALTGDFGTSFSGRGASGVDIQKLVREDNKEELLKPVLTAARKLERMGCRAIAAEYGYFAW